MIRIDPETENRVVELARNGNRPNEISTETGLPTHYVRKLIQKHNVKIVPQSRSKMLDLYHIIALLINGKGLSEIADKYGVTRQYIFLIKEKAKSAGIPIPEKEVERV